MQYLTRSDLKARGIDRTNTTLLKWERAGNFPCRMYLAEKTVVWDASEIDAWLASRSRDRYRTRVMVPAHKPWLARKSNPKAA